MLHMLSRRAVMMLGSVLCFSASAGVALSGKYNPTLTVGDTAPAWKSLPGTDDKSHSLADLKAKSVVVVAFTCNSCPYAVDYEDRLIALANKHAGANGRAAVVAINVNKIPEDSLSEMKKRATSKQFPFAYLYDESQEIAKAYGATFTPEFFVLDAQRKVIYMGAMDDETDASKVTVNYVERAIEAALQGKTPEVSETIGRGCFVRYARTRKKP